MFFSILKKDFKLALSNPLHIFIVLIIPLLVIVMFGFTMKNYMSGNYGTLDDAKLFYVNDGATEDNLKKFSEIEEIMNSKLGVEFEEVSDYSKACDDVEASKAFGVIKITSDGFDYFRSDFNETYGGSIVRSLFKELAENDNDSATLSPVNSIELDVKKVKADVYYTFAGLAISILFLGVIMSNSLCRDYDAGTFERIKMSKTGVPMIILSKFVCGMIFGIIQIGFSLAIATLVYDISWKHNFGLILLVHFIVMIFSLSFGLIVGMLIRNATTSFGAISFCAMIANYLGGSVTPVYLLEKIPVLKHIIKISPIYWTNQSLTNLYNDINDSKTRNCIIVLIALSVVFLFVTLFMASSGNAVPAKKSDTGAKKKEAV